MKGSCEEFLSRLEALKRFDDLISSHEDNFGIVKKEFTALVETLKESLAILPVAFFEDYLKRISESFIDKLNEKEPRVSWERLPVNLRRAHLFETPFFREKKPSDGNDREHQKRVMEEMKENLNIITSPIDSPDSYILSSIGLTDTQSNPNAKTMKQMFNKIGIDNIFNDEKFLDTMKNRNSIYSDGERVKVQLNEIVDRRHAVAHGQGLLNIPKADLFESINFLENLAISIKETIEYFFESLSL